MRPRMHSKPPSADAVRISPHFGQWRCMSVLRRTPKVSDGSQPPMTLDLSLGEPAGSRSLDRLVRQSKVHVLKNLRSDSLRKRSVCRPGHRTRNVSENPAKHTERNRHHRRQTSQPPNSTGANRENRAPTPSPFPPLPPVQKSQRRSLIPNARGERRG